MRLLTGVKLLTFLSYATILEKTLSIYDFTEQGYI